MVNEGTKIASFLSVGTGYYGPALGSSGAQPQIPRKFMSGEPYATDARFGLPTELSVLLITFVCLYLGKYDKLKLSKQA